MRKKIGIDLDDTLNCLVDKWIQDYNRDYLDNLQKENIKSWDIASYTKPNCRTKIYTYLWQPNFFRNLDIKPYAQEVTKWLSDYYDLYIITAYDRRACKDKAEWAMEHLPHIPEKNIIFCNHKGLLQLDYLIDDGGHNILDFYKTNPNSTGIVFDAPWNRYLGKEYHRVKNWKEIQDGYQLLLENEQS
jgi:5'(3')-deoxyribonucleotidase